MPLGDLFVHVYVLVDDALADRTVRVPRRPGPPPACSDAEVLTIALVRHLLGRRSQAGFLARWAGSGAPSSRACRSDAHPSHPRTAKDCAIPPA